MRKGIIAKGVKGKTYFVFSKTKARVKTFKSLSAAKRYVRGKKAHKKR